MINAMSALLLLLLSLDLLFNAQLTGAFTTSPSIDQHHIQSHAARLHSTISAIHVDDRQHQQHERNGESVNVVLVTGFESFNRELYEEAGKLLPKELNVNLQGMFCRDI